MPKPAAQNIITCLAKFDIAMASTVNLGCYVGDLHNDSREIVVGDIFCGIIGHDQDGRQYIEQAIKQGAKLVLAECESIDEHGEVTKSSIDEEVVIVKFYQLNQHLFILTKCYYQKPQKNMTIVGITGTNGKTTTSQLLAQMLSLSNKSCAVIGTNGAGSLDKLLPVENTTPGACELHQLFNRFNDEHSVHGKFSHVAMEVSSHALSQNRVQADLFDIALFTNLSRDHLDYHGSMASYGVAKKKIFTENMNQVAVVNFDDELGKQWLASWPKQQRLWLYGRDENISNNKYFVTVNNINRHSHGVSFTLISHLGSVDIISPLLGDFNIDNLLAAICVLLIEGASLTDVPNLVKQVNGIAGRMEASSANNLATAVVDYAHTPDALEKALQACRQHCSGELYVVFGCGGDRDKGKRPLMAQAAEKYADFLVVTNDNPRSEDEQLIANDIVTGFINPDAENISVILAREQAVLTTLKKAKAGDIVLLAGKGHEDYVIVAKYDVNGAIIGTEKLAYDERSVVKKFYHDNADLAISTNKANL
ncbi:UDP-N-acetylmuramoyl-L-alanyl-D-glutamate--2,6-diaminopimelate ligase [Colwellia psychrerythraea]|uniref:UDP-N-acetylmuramoyl-L-alanyl-D-glutamate--2,6-diaminopimelate ligase n=1 Tax=Colwellia psychrerythraea TaxID=28229 RepID=A0A099KKC8_COLPS|nr:UDP-N-acetylmuramoyl-L-alanyl-D-glutamate--2,6-diaminopimelate ligase [Colwellia psychrerythraea]KGJ91259.1 UDP-N-acetylmuramoyl-L-alanyl-D-glutamate--2,6-diaminopimelate ligase [Colwellia psychrerythraea]